MTSINRRRKYMPNEEYDDINELYRLVRDTQARVRELEKLMGQRQHYSVWQEPTWQNGYANVSPPLEPFAYKISTSKFPVFKGHIDVTSATSGTVAFTLPVATDEIILPYSVFDNTVVTDDGGTTWVPALMSLDDTTGQFKLVWPAA